LKTVDLNNPLTTELFQYNYWLLYKIATYSFL
jgi:hypothetical protein